MRMKNRFCRMGQALLGAMCLLSTCGITYSCKDDFDLDEKSPEFLGGSIYEELKSRGFNTEVRLIDDLGYTDIMSKTGSKTLFAATDAAFNDFFATTDWKDAYGNPVRSYDQLSTSQKRLLYNGSMLDNAYVLEMMTTMQGPVKNLCLRQLSAAAATDSIRFWKNSELFNNLNQAIVGDDGVEVKDIRFWDRHRNNSAQLGMYMALDKTQPMLTHFLEGQMREKNITREDMAFVLNLPKTDSWYNGSTENRSYVYNRRVVEQDITCLNGYIHVLDGVLQTPPNMAEVIRQTPNTQLFSSLLERFSAPYYDETLTKNYKALNNIAADSVWQKRYISERSQGGAGIYSTPDKNPEPISQDYARLSFDPGWNEYSTSLSSKEQDMGAMFVPNDEAMIDYFVRGGGKTLIERYGKLENNAANLKENLAQIPLNIVKFFINNLMKESFNESVPSKYLTIMNDAADPMFDASSYNTVAKYRELFETVKLANNGVVYVMKKVFGPATYASVSGPVLFSTNARVVNTVLHADDIAVNSTNTGAAPLRKFYSTYLLAMQSNFSLFVPTDDGLKNKGYVDPVAYSKGANSQRLFWTLEYQPITTNGSQQIAILGKNFTYTEASDLTPTDKPKKTHAANTSLNEGEGPSKKTILTDMIDQHIIVHDHEGDLHSGRKYFLSRNGAPVYIQRAGQPDGKGMVVDGGFQLDLKKDAYEANDFDCTVTTVYDQTRGTNAYGNGTTYFLDRPMQPTMKTTYNVMKADEDGSIFYNLCLQASSQGDLLSTIFRTDNMDEDDWNSELKRYQIFDPDRITARGEYLVRFFNSYRYTVYVPDNSAMENAINQRGLPTWESIKEFVDARVNSENKLTDEGTKKQAQAMVLCLVNFLKYHFQDQSLFVDNVTNSDEYQTASRLLDFEDPTNDSGGFLRIQVAQTPGNITITDAANHQHTISGIDNADNNRFARDYEFDGKTSTASTAIKSSSYVVLHKLNNEGLIFDAKLADSFAHAYETPQEARAFVKKYRLKY